MLSVSVQAGFDLTQPINRGDRGDPVAYSTKERSDALAQIFHRSAMDQGSAAFCRFMGDCVSRMRRFARIARVAPVPRLGRARLSRLFVMIILLLVALRSADHFCGRPRRERTGRQVQSAEATVGREAFGDAGTNGSRRRFGSSVGDRVPPGCAYAATR
jgi:hypothetical protein